MLRLHWGWWAGIGLAGLVALLFWADARFKMAVRTKNAYTNVRDMPSPLTGKAAPDFALPQVGGESVRLSTYRGKAVILNFWSSF